MRSTDHREPRDRWAAQRDQGHTLLLLRGGLQLGVDLPQPLLDGDWQMGQGEAAGCQRPLSEGVRTLLRSSDAEET